MIKKTKVVVRKAEPTPPEELYLDELSLTKTLLRDAELRAAKSELTLQSLLLERLVAEIDPTDSIRKQVVHVRRLSTELAARQSEYDELQKSIGERLGIDMREFSYDDVTGKLNRHSEEGSAAQMGQVGPASSQALG